MVALVTGAAGFIGSHLCESLLASGIEVRGIDSFTDYYPRERKLENVAVPLEDDRFTLIEDDLVDAPLEELLEGVDVVYHLAAQPGVRTSWGTDFPTYVKQNVLATQRLLEACRADPPGKLVATSSSSIYGDAAAYPTSETLAPRPISPYGVTKLASEQLCEVYRANFGVPSASLRLFTVYGPRQRPDMAFSRLVECAAHGGVFELYGDGRQTRDFTFVGDVVAGMRQAAESDFLGVANIGGGERVSMADVIDRLSKISAPVEVVRRPASAGDVRDTGADTTVAAKGFGYKPRTNLDEGLRAMVKWERTRNAAAR
jgi:nucleoside-diphosphate-sugar epimerase